MQFLRIAALLVVGCTPTPTLMRVVDQVSPDGLYTTRDVPIGPDLDLHRVADSHARFVVNATIHEHRLMAVDRGTARDSMVSGGGMPSARWLPEGGVAVPLDYDTLNLFSSYVHLREAQTFFEGLQVDVATEMSVIYYHPEIDDRTASLPKTDNAAFLANVDAFLLLPMEILQDVPFSMNPGVLAHEFSHRVFYYEAWGARMFEILLRDLLTLQDLHTWNLIRALDEGVADYFGALLADDPRFLRGSVFASLSEARDLDVLRVMPAAWSTGSEPSFEGVYDPYALGSVIASTLWALGEINGHHHVAAGIIDVERQLADDWATSLQFQVGTFMARVLMRLPLAHREASCQRVKDAFAVLQGSLAGVCS